MSEKDISESDKADIIRFVEHLQARNISKLRATKYVYHLIVLARTAKKPLGQLKKEDVERLVGHLNSIDYSEETKHDYKVALKKYFQWLRSCDEDQHEYPEEVRWIKSTNKRKRLLPKALLTTEELKAIVEAAENPRDRALLLTHYESGCRIGETLSLRIVNVCFDKNGAVLIVDGKTGPRRVRIIAATPALAAWIAIHPLRGNRNAPLWVGLGTVGRYDHLDYDAVRALLKRLVKKSKVNKRVYTRLLRHTRATELSKILTEAQMKELLGWVQGSNMPATYVHLSGRDVDAALLKAQGITPDQEIEQKPKLTLITCPRCRQKAGPETQFCPACGMILNEKAAMSLETERAKADHIMDLLIKDDEVKGLLLKKLEELYASSQLPQASGEDP